MPVEASGDASRFEPATQVVQSSSRSSGYFSKSAALMTRLRPRKSLGLHTGDAMRPSATPWAHV
jgi:hypothetical protein